MAIMEGHQDVKDQEREALEKLYRDAAVTRRNRINASTRLLARERFVQAINIYYSCVAAIVTLLSLIYKTRSFGVASAVLTVILAISIVYLNAQKYGSRAQQLQTNYIALQQLLFDIEAELRQDEVKASKHLFDRYIELMQTSENHNHQDHLKGLHLQDVLEERKARKDGEKAPPKRLRGIEKAQYWSWMIGGLFLKTAVWAAPVMYGLYEVCR